MSDVLELALDWESYFDTQYSLKKLSTPEYVRDDRFRLHGVGVKMRNTSPFWVTHCELADFLSEIPWHRTRLITHTIFDPLALVEHFGHKPIEYVDTAGLARAVLGPNLKYDLGTLMPLLGLGEKGKELAESKGVEILPYPLEIKIGRYSCNDAEGSFGIYDMLYPMLPQKEREILSLTVRMSSEACLVIDHNTIDDGVVQLEADRQAILDACPLDLTTLRSPKKFPDWVRSNVGDPPMKQNPKGQMIPAFGAKDIDFKRFRAAHPEWRHVWDAKLAAMSSSDLTRAIRFQAISRLMSGTMPMIQNYYGAHTGRSSGGGKVNVQNLVRGSAVRLCLTAPEGYMVVVADSSGIEMRMNAWFCDQEDVLELCRQGKDVYSYAATNHFGYEVIKSIHKDERQFGKVLVLALGYNMGVPHFQTQCALGFMGAPPIDLSADEAFTAVMKWRAQNDKIVEMWAWLSDVAIPHMADEKKIGQPLIHKCVQFQHEGILLPNGMLLQYPNLHWDHEVGGYLYGYPGKWTKIYGGKLLENIIQALARVVVFEQMLEIDKLPGDITVASSTHDEVIDIAPAPFAEHVLDRMIRIMSTTPDWAPGLPLDAEGGWAKEYSK